MDEIAWLENWFRANCGGGWEHENEIRISTLDNPGWSVDIPVSETEPDGKTFTELRLCASDGDWMLCRVADGRFLGRGDAGKLGKMLRVFRDRHDQMTSRP